MDLTFHNLTYTIGGTSSLSTLVETAPTDSPAKRTSKWIKQGVKTCKILTQQEQLQQLQQPPRHHPDSFMSDVTAPPEASTLTPPPKPTLASLVSKEKRILSNVSGRFAKGELVGVFGPSGSGKSSLLDVLANRCKQGKVTGTIWADNVAVSRPGWKGLFPSFSSSSSSVGPAPPSPAHMMCSDAAYQTKLGYIMQDDIFMPNLTVRETLLYSLRLKVPDACMTAVERDDVVSDVIGLLGLEKVAESRVGDPMKRGLSGGERRRLSIGVELVTFPSLLLIDEVTTGLDSLCAFRTMKVIQKLCRTGRHTIVCSIHQPRSSIFQMFDRIIFLADGQVLYEGPGGDAAVTYFRDHVGMPACPNYCNPADWMLDMLQTSRDDPDDDEDNEEDQNLDDHEDHNWNENSVRIFIDGGDVPSGRDTERSWVVPPSVAVPRPRHSSMMRVTPPVPPRPFSVASMPGTVARGHHQHHPFPHHHHPVTQPLLSPPSDDSLMRPSSFPSLSRPESPIENPFEDPFADPPLDSGSTPPLTTTTATATTMTTTTTLNKKTVDTWDTIDLNLTPASLAHHSTLVHEPPKPPGHHGPDKNDKKENRRAGKSRRKASAAATAAARRRTAQELNTLFVESHGYQMLLDHVSSLTACPRAPSPRHVFRDFLVRYGLLSRPVSSSSRAASLYQTDDPFAIASTTSEKSGESTEATTVMTRTKGGGGSSSVRTHLPKGVSFYQQTSVLAQRLFLQNRRDKGVLYSRVLTSLAIAVFAGTIFFQQADIEDTVGHRVNALLFLMTAYMFFCMPAVTKAIEDRVLYVRENGAGHCSTAAYLLAGALVETPVLMAVTLGYGCVSYWMIGFVPTVSAFVYFVSLVTLVVLTCFSAAQVCAAAVTSASHAISLYVVVCVYAFLLGGFIVPVTALPAFARWTFSTSFCFYGFEGLVVNEFSGKPYALYLLENFSMVGVDKMRDLSGLAIHCVVYRVLAFILLKVFHAKQ